MADASLYGVLAEFETPEALLDAVRRTRAEGYRALDAFTPFPVEGMAELLEFRDRRILRLGLIGGCLGFVVAFAMQMLVNFDYPLNVGGRPVYALSAFAVVAFELTVLFAALLPAFGMLALNGLPRLHHPVFSASRFHLASKDRFFLCVKADDPRFGRDETPRFLAQIGAQSVELVQA
jgi:Protein of unknown function (DUF3341)